MRFWYLRIAALFLLLNGCGTTASTAPTAVAGFFDAAKRAYALGLSELQRGNYPEAIKQFTTVARSPRYFKYSALATLRIADCLFYQDLYDQALESYEGFIKQYAGDPNVPYALFRVAQSHYEQLPGDWWFLPPAAERDLPVVESAYGALLRFLDRYPNHLFAPQAEKMKRFCGQRLYNHEMYAAHFYDRRNKPLAVAGRLERSLQRFADLARTEDNLIWLAKSYLAGRDPDGVRKTYQRYREAFTNGSQQQRMETLLREAQRLEAPPAVHAPEPGEAPAKGEQG